MSTRCIVEIKDSSIKKLKPIVLYHHHDGYISGVGYDLLDRFLDTETKKLDIDCIDTVANKLIKDTEDEYEVTTYNHVDIEYKYTIDCGQKTLRCDDVDNWDGSMKVNATYTHNQIVKDYLMDKGFLNFITAKQIKAVHAAVNELGWKDDRYRSLLDNMFRVNTCKALTEDQASILIETLNKLRG